MHNADDVKYTSYMWIAMLSLALAASGCDKSRSGQEEGSEEPSRVQSESEPTASATPWRVGRVRVERGAAPGDLELPDEALVGQWLRTALEESATLKTTESESDAFVSYRAAVVDEVAGVPADEQPFLRIRVQGQLSDPDRPDEVNELMALGIERDHPLDELDGPLDSQTTRELLREAVGEYVSIAEARFAVLSADEGELVDLLASPSLPPEVVLTAVHEARERKIDNAVPVMAALLEHDSPTVVVAAAAALAQMAHDERATDIVEAAGRLGREREYASLHRLIFIIGDLDSPVARQYLEGLTGHKIPDIRRAAQQVMDRGRVETSRGGQ